MHTQGHRKNGRQSPLITPKAIFKHGTETLPENGPDFCLAWARLPDPDEPAQGAAIWVVGESFPVRMTTSALEAGLLLEVTRFGVGMVSNRNTPEAAPGAIFYPKLSFPDFPKDNIPVQRLLGAAGAGEAVSRNALIPSDLRGAARRKQGGRSSKDAWELVRHHCARLCAAAFETEGAEAFPFTADDYLANLEALYVLCQEQNTGEA